MGPRFISAFASIAIGLLGACRPMTYDIDRMPDPLDKARYSCQYLLERALATESEKDADGVLRRRIADFAPPQVTQDREQVTILWPPGAITRRADASPHHGRCVIRLRPNGRHVEAVTLDGAALHAGFGM
jgi:hypothetical protein